MNGASFPCGFIFTGLSWYPGVVGFRSSCLVLTNTFYFWTAGLFPSLFAWTINPRKYKIRTSALNLGIIKPYFTIICPPFISFMSHFEI